VVAEGEAEEGEARAVVAEAVMAAAAAAAVEEGPEVVDMGVADRQAVEKAAALVRMPTTAEEETAEGGGI
jgi:hypothetical protein